MQISEIKGDKAVEVLVAIIQPIANIATDPDAKAIFAPEAPAEGADPYDVAMTRLKEAIPSLLAKHTADAIEIMAAVNCVTADEYRETLTLPKLLKDVMDLLTDETLLGFFV